jgi:hypothetical protein
LPPPDDVIVSSKGEVINLSTELTKRKSSKKKKATTATILFFLYGKISGVSYGIYYGVEVKNGLNQKQLAERVGVTQQYISKIENGEFSSVATLEKVLLFIGYTVKMQAIPLSQHIKNKIEKQIRNKGRVQFA